jgi:hypothetical protein
VYGERGTTPRVGEEEDEEDEDLEKEDKEEKEEEEEEEKEEEPVARIEGRPTISQIKKMYPDIFKKIPYLREMYFSDEKFRQHIADPEQAEEFAEKASNFDRLESSVMSGDPSVLLTEINESSPAVLKKMAGNFLPTIRKIDPNLYTEVTIPIIEELLYHAARYAEARGENGKNLLRSAEWISDFVFQNGGQIPDLKTRDTEKHPAEIELEKERQRYAESTRSEATKEINSKIDRSLDAMAREGLGDELNNFAKSAVIDRTLSEFINSIKNDRAFQMRLGTLWKAARAASFSEVSKEQIASAYIQRARQVLRGIRAKYVQEALGNRRRLKTGQEKQETTEEEKAPRKRSFESHGRSGKSGSRRETVLDSSKIDYSRTSDEDILSGDPARVKLKGR